MADEILVFHLTPEQVEEKRAALEKEGITLTLPAGEIHHDTILGEVVLGYTYDAAAGTIEIDLKKVPHFGKGKVISKIDEWFGVQG